MASHSDISGHFEMIAAPAIVERVAVATPADTTHAPLKLASVQTIKEK